MNCELSKNHMMKYFDGALNDIEHAQLKQHLKSCAACNEEYAALKKVFAVIEDDHVCEPPEDFEFKVMAEVNQIEAVRKKKAFQQKRIFMLAAAGVFAAALLIIYKFNIGGIGDTLNSAYQSLATFYSVISFAVSQLFKVTSEVLKAYNFYIALIMLLAIMIQKLFLTIRKQGSIKGLYLSLARNYTKR